jgi:hypothetical protein
MGDDRVEFHADGNTYCAECRSGGIASGGKARPANARWYVTVNGDTAFDVPADRSLQGEPLREHIRKTHRDLVASDRSE